MSRLLLPFCALAFLSLSACDTGDGIPRGVEIYQVVIEDTPLFQPNGERWDGGIIPSGPDVYFLLVDRSGNILLNTDDEEFNRDVSGDGVGNYTDIGGPDFPLVWDLEPDFYLPGFDRSFEIVVVDDDPTTADDEMDFTEAFTFRSDDAPVDVDTDLVLRSPSGDTTVRIRYRVVD
ncbi:MAG: hypothetical protein Rubg2KO_08350 [Rubricoccaceae bacterium]